MSGGTGSSIQLVTPTSHFLTVHKTAVEYSVIIVLNRNIGQLSTDLGVRGQRSEVKLWGPRLHLSVCNG